MKRIFLITILVLFALSTNSSAETLAGIPWGTDQTTAFESAVDATKPVVVDLWAVWCAPCKVMDETTYSDPRVIEAFKEIVPLKLDIDAEPIFPQRYDLVNYPTTLFLDHEAREITRLEGLVDADQLLNTLQSVIAGYGTYLESVEQRDDPQALRSVSAYLIQVGNDRGAGDYLRQALKAVQGDDSLREELELMQAETWLVQGRSGAAAKAFDRLSTQASTRERQGRALLGLIRAERDRGKNGPADQALERLKTDFAELTDQL